jgi:transposase
MVTDQQVRRLFKLVHTERSFGIAAAKSGMDEKTARKYLTLQKLPSELKKAHSWRTRADPFEDVWPEIESTLELIPGLEAKTIFEYLQRQYPGRFADGQLRTLQRRVKTWRACSGPAKQIYFPQVHYPGQLCQSDFTSLNQLDITINGQRFDHLLFHFVLTYSNWETGTICFSESFESLSQGLQNALWRLGGVPQSHQTDCLTTAVHKTDHPEIFTRRYQDLLDHYDLLGSKTNPSSPNENGDIEQRHHRFKRAVEQALLLRGSRDFADRLQYQSFLDQLLDQLNAGRTQRFLQEQEKLKRLPDRRIDSYKKLTVKVGPSSTIHVAHNTYSVDSRLIGESIEVRMHMDHLQIWYGQKNIDAFARLRGEGKHAINYRHIIDSLIRKPGAFENYRYRDDLFPTTRFRVAYDSLKDQHGHLVAAKQYLTILHLAARDSEAAVDDALKRLIQNDQTITAREVIRIVKSQPKIPDVTDIKIASVDLTSYDQLLEEVAL